MLFFLTASLALVAAIWFFFFKSPAPNYDVRIAFIPRSAINQHQRKYKDKVVVITGASSGIGHELAKKLSKFRPKLVIAARNEKALNELKEVCLKEGAKEVRTPVEHSLNTLILIVPKVLTVVTDVSKRADCKNLVDKTLDKFKAIDVLFLNAGVSQADRIRNSTVEVLEQVSP